MKQKSGETGKGHGKKGGNSHLDINLMPFNRRGL